MNRPASTWSQSSKSGENPDKKLPQRRREEVWLRFGKKRLDMDRREINASRPLAGHFFGHFPVLFLSGICPASSVRS